MRLGGVLGRDYRLVAGCGDTAPDTTAVEVCRGGYEYFLSFHCCEVKGEGHRNALAQGLVNVSSLRCRAVRGTAP